MNNIDTYELSKEIAEVLAKDYSVNAMKMKFADLSTTCLSSDVQRQALIQAINDKCDKDKVKEIFSYADKLMDEYTWRNTTEEMKKQLKEYNCDEPFVVCADIKEAYDAFNEGYPIFAIKKDGSYSLCNSDIDIKEAEKEGCIFGSSQFTMDDIMEKMLSLDDD